MDDCGKCLGNTVRGLHPPSLLITNAEYIGIERQSHIGPPLEHCLGTTRFVPAAVHVKGCMQPYAPRISLKRFPTILSLFAALFVLRLRWLIVCDALRCGPPPAPLRDDRAAIYLF